MKNQTAIWLAFFAFTMGCLSEQTEEDRKFFEEVEKSQMLAVEYFPDTTKEDSRLVKRMFEFDAKLGENEDPLYYSPDKPFILTQIAASDLGISPAKPIPDHLVYQPKAKESDVVAQSDEERKFHEEFTASEQRAVTAYPDTTNADSTMIKRIIELENEWRESEDPRYFSSDKPMLLSEIAAKELGIVAVTQVVPDLIINSPFRFENELLPEFLSYKSVKVTKVEPDGLRIIHEYGAIKIQFEELSAEQRTKYGMTAEGADQYRKQVAANTAAYYAREREIALQAQANAEAEAFAAQAAAEQEAQNRANRPPSVGAPSWKRFVMNSTLREHYRDDIAEEIRQEDGEAAANRFLAEERAKDPDPVVQRPFSVDDRYQRRGDRIIINGDPTSGYRIKGNKLYSPSSGAPTHIRSGSMWIPMNRSHPQIRDPER
jgi:hypothetical protein